MIVGEELTRGAVILRDLADGSQRRSLSNGCPQPSAPATTEAPERRARLGYDALPDARPTLLSDPHLR